MRGLAFDVVLLDVMMPGESGLDLARDLKATRQHPDLHVDRACRARASHRGSRGRRRRLRPQALRAARAAAAAAAISCGAAGAQSGPRDEIRMGDLRFHVARGELKRDEETIKLTERERDLLRLVRAASRASPIAAPRAVERRLHRQRARHRRADQPAEAQDRDRSVQSRLPADGPRQRLYPLYRLRTADAALIPRGIRFEHGDRSRSAIASEPGWRSCAGRAALGRANALRDRAPATMQLLGELAARRASTPAPSSSSSRRSWCWKAWSPSRSWSGIGTQVTRRLSEATARDIAALVDLYETTHRQGRRSRKLIDLAREPSRACRWQVLPAGEPARRRSPSRSSLCSIAPCPTRSAQQVKRPFWIDTVGQSQHVEIRVKLDHAILRFVAHARRRPTPRTRTSSCSGWSARR